jgi:transposase-like protein
MREVPFKANQPHHVEGKNWQTAIHLRMHGVQQPILGKVGHHVSRLACTTNKVVHGDCRDLPSKKGISANQVGRTIGVTTKTAWYLCHRIREAMSNGELRQLAGTIEMDETYVGGKKKRGEAKESWYQRKYPVIGIVEREGEVRFRKVPRATTANVKPVFEQHVSRDVHRIVTDESGIYPWMFDDATKLKHFTINHSQTYANGWIHTNTVESSFSNFKRGLVGSFHRLSYKHLDRYLQEFEFRQNNRKNPAMFQRVLQRAGTTPHLTLRALVDGQESPF